MPDLLCFALVDEQLAILDPISKRDWPAHRDTLLLGGRDLVADAFASDLTLELGERQQHVKREPTHAGGGVETLGDADEACFRLVEHLDDLGKVGKAAGQPVDLVEEDDVDLASFDIGEQPLKAGPLQIATREAAIIVAILHQHPAFVPLAERIGCAGLVLGVETVEFLLETVLGGLAGVYRAAQQLLSHCR